MMSDTTPTTTRRILASVAVTATLALGVGAVQPGAAEASAPATAARVSTTIKVTPSKKFITGKISSPRAACRKDRSVALFFKKRRSGTFAKIRTPRSNDRGVWIQKAPGSRIPSGFYYAKIAGKAGCERARSRTLKFG